MVSPKMIRFDILIMSIEPSLKRALILPALAGSLLSIGGLTGCSGEVKVQRVIYDAPDTVALDQPSHSNQTMQSRDESAQAVEPVIEPLSTIELCREALEAIYDIDAELVASSMQEDPNRIHSLKMIEQYDRQHAQTLMTIIERFGWPTREMVGIKAVQGAYIAVQHAGHDPDFQSNCLALIQQQVDQGELPGAFLALMTDRVAVAKGESQIYGTQMTMAPDEFGVMHAVPAADITETESLDQRRAALGMPGHDRFIEAIEMAYFESVGQSRTSSVPTE